MRLQELPRTSDVTLARAEMPDREPQSDAIVQDRVREKHLAGGVHGREQLFVERVELGVAHQLLARPGSETDHAERYWCEALKIGIRIDPLAEQLRQTDVLGESGPDALGSKMTKDHPKFQRPEAPAE